LMNWKILLLNQNAINESPGREIMLGSGLYAGGRTDAVFRRRRIHEGLHVSRNEKQCNAACPPIPPGGHPPPAGWIDGIAIENLQLVDADPTQKTACHMIAFSEHNPIQNILIKNMLWPGEPVAGLKSGRVSIAGAVSGIRFKNSK